MAGDEHFPIDTGGGSGARRDDRSSGRSSRGRVPPHNIAAEESVLGAMLLSREAIGAVSEMGLNPSDFYKPAHRHIFDAIRSLYSGAAPADTVTVADELRRAGLLDEVGGPAALHELQNATPAISSAGHYAKIVQETALLRQLIYAAGDIAELAYSEPDDVIKALDEAETKVFNVAEQRVSDTTRTIEELLPEVMDHLQATYDRGDTITGVPTGYTDLDELLSGLQPSALYIVGARPAMGKCVAWDTPIVDPDTGDLVTALELMERAEHRGAMRAIALDAAARRTVTPMSHCLADGVKPVFTVRTRSGRTATVTAAHPFLTDDGWRPLERIDVGEAIAVPTSLPVFGREQASPAEIEALVAEAASATRLPGRVFRLARPHLAALLAQHFDGTAEARVACSGRAAVRYWAASERAAHEIAHLLLRFGVTAEVADRCAAPTTARHGTVWEVAVRDPASLVRFCDEIGIVGQRERVAAVRDVAVIEVPYSSDRLPAAAWDDVLKARGDLPWPEVNRRCRRAIDHDWSVDGPRLRRDDVALLAEALDDEQLRWWASPDVRWDEVVEIAEAGWTQVIDFTVPELQNFVAADLYLHNTAFGLGLASHVAMHSAKPVLVFSLEMGHQELTQRILSSEARVDSTKIRTGKLAEADWAKIGKAIGRLEVPLFLDDNPRITVMEIRAKARRIKARYGGIGLIVIDYLQLMGGSGGAENRQLEVSEISRNLKILARELEVPIVALSQLSRNLEARADKRPMLSDLRESGSLEQDADVVMFLYRDEVYHADSPDKGSAEVIVAKHRAGPIGTKRLVFLGQYTRFDNAARSV
jgi:replicative DNA helicase